MKNKTYIGLLFILSLIFLLISIAPLLHQDFFQTHETDLYPILQYEFDQGIKSGHLLPRWSSDLWLGLGSPYFNFIQPLFFYLTELFHLFGFGLVVAIKIVVILGFILGFISMYLFAKSIWGRAGGLLAAVIFTFYPYRLALVYIRGDFTEFFATSLMPLVLFFFSQLIRTKKLIYFLLSSLSLALLLLGNNIQAFIFLPLLIFYLLVIYWQNIKENLLSIILALILGLGLTSFFILPAFFEKKYLNLEALTSGNYDFHNHFLEIDDLFLPKWSSFDFYQIGITSIIILIFTIYLLIYKRKQFTEFEQKNLYFSLILIIVSSLLTLSVSRIFWENLPFFKFFQFPWRFLSFLALAFALLAGILLRPEITKLFFKQKKSIELLIIVFSIIIVLVNSIFARPVSYLPIEKDEYYDPLKQILSDVKGLKKDEINQINFTHLYNILPDVVPRGVAINKAVDLIQDEIISIKASGEGDQKKLLNKVNILQGDITWEYQKLNPNAFNLKFTAQEESAILVNQFWFPGWQAYLDGRKININHDNNLQIMTFVIPNGKHLLELRFTNTFLRSFSEIISLLALAIWLILLYKIVIKRRAV